MLDRLKALAPYVLLLGAAAYLYRAAGAFASAARPGELGPDAWPRAVLAILMVVCVCAIVRRALFPRIAAPVAPEAPAAEVDAAADAERFPLRLGIGVALTIAYVLTLDTLGFFVATALYLALFMVVGRYLRGRVIVSSAVLGSLAFVFVFMKVVYVSLPLGVGPFKALSVWILALIGVR
ncbi:MAG TPA: tripartite tricarboxylate transporter TctB family protein [Casimicrobiaceae bacterium]|nr:tripartite tricarboxylate transporter TctB family protein [Casimicrobiaceae bacterium]